VMPSVEQNRPCAKGRSFEIASTTVFLISDASLLNFLTEVAQTDVSRLGKILSMTFLPLCSKSDILPRSVFTRVKSGALVPFPGRFPDVFTGLPFNVIFAIFFFYKFTHSFLAGKVCEVHIRIWKKSVGLHIMENPGKKVLCHQDTKTQSNTMIYSWISL